MRTVHFKYREENLANDTLRHENAVLTIRSKLVYENEEPEWSELNTKANYRFRSDEAVVIYTDVDERGEAMGQTAITVTGFRSGNPLVSIHKTGFTDALMVLETGKTHPVEYDTVFGTISMQLHAIQVRADLSQYGGELYLRYAMDVGDHSENINTIVLRVTMQATADSAVQHRSI